jgi:formyltetrahydrofolate-dependent phosphoribosylglycinamide formyltransferase
MDGFARVRNASPQDPLRLAVLISGSGSGMEALLRHQANGCAHTTVVVISNKAGVGGLERARAFSTPTEVVEVTNGREEHEERLLTTLAEYDVEAVILSGYMRVLTPLFVRAWKGRLLNIHPSLLPKYPGAHAHRDALADGATVSGCTVHLVDEGVDSGPILAQSETAIAADETVESLQEKIKALEHRLYPAVIDDFASGEI